MSLILGVLGVVPVFADVADATCVVDDSEGLSVTWNGVPAGLELILLAETSNGRLRTVVTGNVDNVVGYGSSGSWTGTPERRAVAYSLYSDPAAGGGSIPCAPPGSTTDRDTPVEIVVQNGIGASNPGFQTGTCPSDPDGRKYGWHFILTGNSSSFLAVDVVFESAGRVTDFVSDPTPKHAYVYTAAPDVIVSASAVIDGPAGTRLVLSHVCTPAAAPAPSPTATASVAATSTVPPEPTSTVPPETTSTVTPEATSTASPEPTSTATLVPTSTVAPEATSTATPVPTSTVAPEATATPVPTSTATPEPTSTASPDPTSTATPQATTTATPLPASTPVPDREPDLMAKIVVDCDAGVFSASITNSGGGAGLAEFVLDGVVVGTATVSAGETLVVAQPIPAGSTNFAVVADGATLASSSVTDPCAVPAPELHVATVLDCSAETIAVSVENRGTAVGTASVSVNGAVLRVDVAPGATETVHVDRPGDTTEADIVVTSGEVVLLRQLLDTSCTVAGPDLRASVVVACKTRTQPESAIAEVTVVNHGELAGTAGITAAGVTQNVVVAAGDTQTRTYAVAGSGPVSVTVVHNQSVLAAFAATDLCDTPEPEFHAEAILKCEIDKVEVLVGNSGTGDGVAYVEVNGLTAVLDVPAGGSAWHEAPVLVGDSNRVVVHDGNVNLLDINFEDTCTAPEADLGAAIAVDCAASAATVTLTNTGDVAGMAAISLDTVEIAAILVGPGETITHVVDFDPVAGHTVLVTAAAGSVELMTADIDPCSTPESDISAVSLLDCDAGSVAVTVTNHGDAPGTAVIDLDGTQETVVVAPGQVVVRSATVAIGDTSTVQVTVDGIVILDKVTSDTCTIPEAAIVASTVLDCGNREIVVRLENGGTVAGEAAIVINGVRQTVAVPAESSLTVPGAISAAGDYLVDVSVDGTSILTEQATGACAVPQGSLIATIDLSCTHAEARVAISNGLTGKVVVTLTVNGTDESVSIPAGQVVERAVPLGEDEAYDISVGAEDGVLLVTSSGTFDCENADVKAKTKLQDPKDPAGLTRLPRTGAASSAVLATAGVAFVLTGAVAMKASSVRRERLAEVT